MTPIGPITREERINSLDSLRGFALLGILPANVSVFGMHLAAGNDPTVAGGDQEELSVVVSQSGFSDGSKEKK